MKISSTLIMLALIFALIGGYLAIYTKQQRWKVYLMATIGAACIMGIMFDSRDRLPDIISSIIMLGVSIGGAFLGLLKFFGLLR